MARGIVCPRCNASSEGNYEIGETIQCGACKSPFAVGYDDIQRYQLARQKQRLKQIQIENRTPAQKVGFKTLEIIGGILFVLVLFFIGFKFALSEKQTSAEIKAEIAKDHQKQAKVTIATPEQNLQKIHNQVAADKIAEYEIAKGNGDKMKACVLAGHINYAFLSAKDEEHYRIWRGVEKDRCAEAGVPIKE